MRILVAEDDLDNARLLENILRKNEHTVKVVPDGAKALQRLRDEKFDALLIDWMDARNGWDNFDSTRARRG